MPFWLNLSEEMADVPEVENIKLEENNGSSTSAVDEEDFVDPWTVTSKSDTGVDYEKLISK